MSTGEPRPPGRSRDAEWPVVHEGRPPEPDGEPWILRMWGQVDSPGCWTVDELAALPRSELSAAIHSPRGWSSPTRRWCGVSSRELISRARPLPDATYAVIHGHGSYTAGLPLSAFAAADVLLAFELEDEPVPAERGGPLRLVAASRFGWKWVKWVRGVELLNKPWPDTGVTRGRSADGAL